MRDRLRPNDEPACSHRPDALRLVGGFRIGIFCVVEASLLSQAIAEVPRLREQATEPYRAGSGQLGPQALVVLGAYESHQVNVGPLGQNIVGDAANEPSIAANPNNPNQLAIGWRQFDSVTSDFRQAGYAFSTDAGRHWRFPGVLTPGVFRSDPVLTADADGTLYYYSLNSPALHYACDMFKSTNGGVSWSPPISAYGGDKAWIAIDRTIGVGHNNIYAVWDFATEWPKTRFARSTDSAASFQPPVALLGNLIFGTVAVGVQGEVYVAGIKEGDHSAFQVARSSNARNPASVPIFEISAPVNLDCSFVYLSTCEPIVPNPRGLHGQVWIDVDRSTGPFRGSVYLLCSVDPPGPDPMDVMFVRSTDFGETWSTPTRINDDTPGTTSWQWFGTMSVAPNGRIDAVWNDTRGSGQVNICQTYYSSSSDGGVTWSPNQPISTMWDSYVGWPQSTTSCQNKIGDYYHMVSDNVGANLAYAATFNGEQDVFFLRIGEYDCNGNGLSDSQDIDLGRSTDFNNNGIPDSCDRLGDANCDGRVDALDISLLLEAVLPGPICFSNYTPYCDVPVLDINGDGCVTIADVNPFAALLLAPGA